MSKIIVKDWDNLCPCCKANQQSGKDLDNSSHWLITYNCHKCGSMYKVNYGDKMGGGFDEVEIIKNKNES